MRNVEVIETKRLKLRQMRTSDAKRVAQLCGDPAVARMILRAPLPYLPIAAEGWIMTLAARKPLAEDFVYAVELEGEGLIGCIGAHKTPGGGFEIGYWFGQPYWGRGYASEALQAFLQHAKALGPLHAGHFADNPASGRVLAKAGFAYTGEEKPMFSLARGESALCKRMQLVVEAERGFGPREAVAA
jgi:RimJ/RimL family protein N-acetyltransferase